VRHLVDVKIMDSESDSTKAKTDADNGRENEAGQKCIVDSHGISVSANPLGQPSKRRHWVQSIGKLILSQWFLISLGLVIVIASQVQVPQSQQTLKSTLVSYICISLIFFLTGLTLNTKILLDNYSRWKIHLFVQLQCYFMTSVVVFAIISLCALNKSFMDAGLLLGFLLAGCTPTTISSNVVMTDQANGNKALTVVQSTLGNFLAPFLTPVIFQMYLAGHPWYSKVLPSEKGGYGEIYKRVFKQLGLSLFVPMVSVSKDL
jgi:solute carrier family 10 (sodium/bile acid cotransporter), member 7